MRKYKQACKQLDIEPKTQLVTVDVTDTPHYQADSADRRAGRYTWLLHNGRSADYRRNPRYLERLQHHFDIITNGRIKAGNRRTVKARGKPFEPPVPAKPIENIYENEPGTETVAAMSVVSDETDTGG